VCGCWRAHAISRCGKGGAHEGELHAQAKATQGPPKIVSGIIPEFKLDMVLSIDGVLPDLHYLVTGSGDVAIKPRSPLSAPKMYLLGLFLPFTVPSGNNDVLARPSGKLVPHVIEPRRFALRGRRSDWRRKTEDWQAIASLATPLPLHRWAEADDPSSVAGPPARRGRGGMEWHGTEDFDRLLRHEIGSVFFQARRDDPVCP
jgi:hypothetical protein